MPVSRDARLKQVMANAEAEALNQQIASRITQVEAALTKESALRSCSKVHDDHRKNEAEPNGAVCTSGPGALCGKDCEEANS